MQTVAQIIDKLSRKRIMKDAIAKYLKTCAGVGQVVRAADSETSVSSSAPARVIMYDAYLQSKKKKD